jgi:hypothetical protein
VLMLETLLWVHYTHQILDFILAHHAVQTVSLAHLVHNLAWTGVCFVPTASHILAGCLISLIGYVLNSSPITCTSLQVLWIVFHVCYFPVCSEPATLKFVHLQYTQLALVILGSRILNRSALSFSISRSADWWPAFHFRALQYLPSLS